LNSKWNTLWLDDNSVTYYCLIFIVDTVSDLYTWMVMYSILMMRDRRLIMEDVSVTFTLTRSALAERAFCTH